MTRNGSRCTVVSLPLAVAACGTVAESPHAPSKEVPVYEGRDAALFDDTIETLPDAPSPSGSGDGAPARDTMLRERTLSGDAVTRREARCFGSSQTASRVEGSTTVAVWIVRLPEPSSLTA